MQNAESIDVSHPLRFTWLHTSDIHSRLIPYTFRPGAADKALGLAEENAPFGGAARMAYLIKRERERSQRVLHMDSGDCFQGAPIFNYKKGEVEMRFMKLLRPDAVVIGNHEFDEGITNYVNQLQKWSQFPTLAANYLFPDARDVNKNKLGRLAQPYEIYSVKGIKVAIIGMANLSSLNSIGEGGNSLQIMPLEQNQILRFYVDMLRPSVDLVTVVSHLGLTEDEDAIRGYDRIVNHYCDDTLFDKRSCLQANEEIIEELPNGLVRVFTPGVSNVDIIFGGHLHIVLNPPKVVPDPNGRNTLLVHSGAFAKYVGRLDTMIDNDVRPDGSVGKKIIAHKYQALPIDNRLAGLEDADAVRLMAQYDSGLNQVFDLKRVVGYAPLNIPRAPGGDNGNSPIGDLLAEAMRRRRRVEAQFAITNTLGIRDNIYAGPITLETLFNVLPFENSITIMSISGYDVQDLFDFATDRGASRACNPQAQIAGVNYIQNCAQTLANQRTGTTVHTAQQIEILDPSRVVYQDAEDASAVNQDPGNPDPIDHPRIRAAAYSPLNLDTSYKMATNNYMAAGGSGFRVLKRNSLQLDTGISLRDAIVDYFRDASAFPSCGDYDIQNHVCENAGNDVNSRRLCADLQLYKDTPCITMPKDKFHGHIKRQLVLATDQGAVTADPTIDDSMAGN